MNDRVVEQQLELGRRIRDHEDRIAEDLGTIRLVRQQWESYEVVMRENAERVEEASLSEDAGNYFSQRTRAARSELGSYVRQLVREQAEELDEVERAVRSRSEDELDRLRQEKAGASWD